MKLGAMRQAVCRGAGVTLLCLAVAALVGCGGKPSTAGQSVRIVTNPEQVAGCKLLGRVAGSSSLGGIAAQQAGKARAENELRDKAARLGADVILVEKSSGGFFGAEAYGDAYRCPSGYAAPAPPVATPPQPSQAPQAPAPPAAGCVKDTDCKGDRICENGRCVSPK